MLSPAILATLHLPHSNLCLSTRRGCWLPARELGDHGHTASCSCGKAHLVFSLLTKIMVQGCFLDRVSIPSGMPGFLSVRSSLHSGTLPETPMASDSLSTDPQLLKTSTPLCFAWVFPPPVVTQNMCPHGSQSPFSLGCYLMSENCCLYWIQFTCLWHQGRSGTSGVVWSGQIWKCEILCF